MESIYQLLERLAADGYHPSDIPGPEDMSISEAMSRLGTSAAFGDLASRIDLKIGRILSPYAVRMAELALRDPGSAQITEGLAAAQLAMMVDDDRDVLPIYAMLYRSAEEIGLDATAVFRAGSVMPENLLAETPAEFASRTPEDRSVEGMGINLIEESGDRTYQAKPW